MNKFRKLHKWLGIAIGIQILLWVSGGVLMSVIPIDMVRGKHLIQAPADIDAESVLGSEFRADLSRWQSTKWMLRAGTVILQTTAFDGATAYIDPASGDALAELLPSQIKSVAEQAYIGNGKLMAVERLSDLPSEVSSLSLPLYRVQFDDWINSSLYISADTGEIKSVRSDLWRIYDFFWMLHIMDYGQRDNFNNPLLIAVASGALIFTMTGFVLLYFSLLKPQLRKFRYRYVRQ